MSESHNQTKIAKVVIFHTVEDVEDWFSGGGMAGDDIQLVSTHGSVNDYLKFKSIKCLEISELISNDLIKLTMAQADRIVDERMRDLDKELSSEICTAASLPHINVFYTMYRYLAKNEYLGISKLIASISKLLQSNPGAQIISYKGRDLSLFEGEDSYIPVLQSIAKKHSCDLQWKEHSIGSRKQGTKESEIMERPSFARSIGNMFRQAYASPGDVLPTIAQILKSNLPAKVDLNKKNVLLIGTLSDIQFLSTDLKFLNAIHWSPATSYPRNLGLDDNVGVDVFFKIGRALENHVLPDAFEDSEPSAINLTHRTVIRDFNSQFKNYIVSLIVFDRFFKKYGTSLAVWGVNPSIKPVPLIIEYLLKKKVKVLGMQHGSTPGLQYFYSGHWDSTFAFCTDYMSYGFNKSDLEALYPERTINFDIHPVGSYREEKRISEKKVHRKIVDLVFPVTNSFPMTTDGVRTKTDDLTRFQVEILDFLDTLTELNVVIKPIPNYSRKVCSVVDTIKHMQHATIHEGWSTNAWIKVYEPRALIIELPSTPLFELMAGDTEIFMLKDTLNPFSESALEMLKKRAHIFDDVADLKIAVLEWKSGSLPKLRDQSFYNHYVYKPNTHDRVIDLVNSLVRHAAN